MPGMKTPFDSWILCECADCENHYMIDPAQADPICPRDKHILTPVAPEHLGPLHSRYNWICAGCGVLRQIERRHANPCALCGAPIFQPLKEATEL